MKLVDETAEIVRQMVDDDKDRDDLWKKIDDAVACRFTITDEIQQLPWVRNRHYGMTNVADARNTGARTFSTLLPHIEIAPNDDSDAEYQRAEMAEQVWEWEFERMNRVQSKKGFHDRIVEDAITYHAVAFQTEYLPYKFKGMKDSRTKALLARKHCNWSIHNPRTVHSQTNEYDQLQRVAKVTTMTAQQLLDNFPGSKGAAKLKQELSDAKKADLMKVKYTLVDYMDWENRVKWAYAGEGKITKSDVVFMAEAHELPFLPWVIIDYGDPLWKSIIQSGLWENLQYTNLIMYAKSIEQSTRSNMVIKTPDGKLTNVWIDFSNPSNPIVVPQDGTEVTGLNPVPIDPQLSMQFQKMIDMVSASTVSQILTNVGQYANAPFSTVEKIVQLALGQLSPAKKTAESAEAEGIYQGFQWIEHSKIPMAGYRSSTSDNLNGDNPRKRGEEIAIFPGSAPTRTEIEKMTPEALSGLSKRIYFDLEQLYISVKVQSDNAADEQTRANLMINATDRLGMSKRKAWEFMGWKNFDLEQSHRADEVLFDAELQKQTQLTLLEVKGKEMEMQANLQMKMQQQQQQQQQDLQNRQNEMNAGTQFASVQGRDMRSGMQPAAQSAPFATREQITGQTKQGTTTT
jgi:hypothetical protein